MSKLIKNNKTSLNIIIAIKKEWSLRPLRTFIVSNQLTTTRLSRYHVQ